MIATYGECAVCRGRTLGEGTPVGIDCGCGHHFHIGAQLLVRVDECIRCPRCELTCTPLDIKEHT